jgi:hypothetical protein
MKIADVYWKIEDLKNSRLNELEGKAIAIQNELKEFALKRVELLIHNHELAVYTCVRLARVAFQEGKPREAIYHLAGETDKLRMYSPEIVDLIEIIQS